MVNPLSLYLKDVLGIKSLIWPDSVVASRPTSVSAEVLSPVATPQKAQIAEALQVEDGGLQGKASLIFLSMKTARSSLFAEEPYGLFRKMRAAMKLDPLSAPLVEIDPKKLKSGLELESLEKHLNLRAAGKYVLFSCQLAQKVLSQDWNEGELKLQQERHCLCTLDPRVLLKSPAKKREAWDDLQKIMKG